MVGVWRYILIFAFLVVSTIANGQDIKYSSPIVNNAEPNALENDFKAVISKVKDRLLDAPEATYLYLAHWIELYNFENILPETAALQLPPLPEKIDNFTPKQNWEPNGYPVVSPEWAFGTPFSFADPARFRPPSPPTHGPIFEKDIKNVLLYGDAYSEVRTPEQSLIAAFWANGIGTETPPGRWNIIALEESRHLPHAERVNLMLKLNIALYDAGIAAWDSKYHYSYWRPQSAISKTYSLYADWQPMMQPPFHPEYVSGHSAFSGAAAKVLEVYLGPRKFCITAPELANLQRCFDSFTQAANEAGQSRIYGGIHYDFSNQAGLKLGRDVAAHVLSTVNLTR